MKTTMNRRAKRRRGIGLILVLLLAAGWLLPAAAAAVPEKGTDWADRIPEMLAESDSTEGSVVAGFRHMDREKADGIRRIGGRDLRVRFLHEISGESLEADVAADARTDPGERLLLAEVSGDGMGTEELLRILAADSRVAWAEPNYTVKITEISGEPDDSEARRTQYPTPYEYIPNMAKWQWGLNDGGIVRDVALNGQAPAPSAHALPDLSGTGSNMDRTVYVAVIDEFADYRNPDLKPMMCHFTPEERAALGCGEWGFNASLYNGGGQDPKDFLPGPHGSHCCGLLGAAWDGRGISGSASNVKILSIQVSDPVKTERDNPFDSAPMEISSVLRAYAFIDRYNSYYAAAAPEKMIRIISMSLGYPATDHLLNAAIYELGQKYNTITFIAAGNETTNDDLMMDVHCTTRENPYAIVVAALDQTGNLSNYSNYGKYTVTLGAPGSNMLSTQPLEEVSYFPGLIRDNPYQDIYLEDFSHYTGQGLKIVQIDRNGSREPYGDYTLSPATWAGGQSLKMALRMDYMDEDEHETDMKNATLLVTIPLTKEQAEMVQVPQNPVFPQDEVAAQLGFIYSGDIRLEKECLMVYLAGEDPGEAAIPQLHRKDTHSTGSWSVCATGPEPEEYGITNLYNVFPETWTPAACVLNVELRFGVTGDECTLYFDAFGIGVNGVAYTIYDGTSMATPTAAGIGAVYASRHPEENGLQLAARIRASVTGSSLLKDMLMTDGRSDLDNDRSGSTDYPVFVPVTWPLYEKDLPLDKSDGDPFRMDGNAPGDGQTYGSFEEVGGLLWYIPAYLGRSGTMDVFFYPQVMCFNPETENWDPGRTRQMPGGPLFDISTCVWNDQLWIYGLRGYKEPNSFFRGSLDDPDPHLYSLNPSTLTWTEHSVGNIDRPGAYVLFANETGLMLLDNDTSGKSEGEEADEKIRIYAYDPETGKGSLIDEYNQFLRSPQIVSHGSTSWIFDLDAHGDETTAFCLREGKISLLDMTLPELLIAKNPMYVSGKMVREQVPSLSVNYKSVIAGDEALYFVGYTDKDRTADTWIMPYGSNSVNPYGKHITRLRSFAVSSVFHDGKIYAIAADWGENRTRVFRSTRVEGTEPTPTLTPMPTPTPTPAPTNTPKPPPKTGDSGHPVLWLGLIVLGAAVLCWFRWMERMKKS